MSVKPTAKQRKQEELRVEFKARRPLIVIRSRETQRLEPAIFDAAADANLETRFWDVARGFTDISGKVIMGDRGQQDPDGALDVITENRSRVVWVMRGLLPWLTNPALGLVPLAKLENLTRPDGLPQRPSSQAATVVLIINGGEIPPQLANAAHVIDWPLPDRVEVGEILDAAVEPVLITDPNDRPKPAEFRQIQEQVRRSSTGAERDAAVDAAIGMTGEEAQSAFATSIVAYNRIDPVAISQEKERIIAKGGVLRFLRPLPEGRAAVGGMENVWAHLDRANMAYSPEARDYGLRSPRGVFLMGVSGCGKSHIIRALGQEWGVPIIDLDLGGLKSKFVGESETNLRNALEQIETFGRCIVRLDEIEKALTGATGEAGDGGVAADALGVILTWMQDRPGEAFVIATCNDANKLPPEFLRKGRFDEVFWVDLPTQAERAAIVAASLLSNKRGILARNKLIDLQAVAEATDKFNGAEVASLVPDAMFVGFADGRREITTDDLLNAAKDVVPLARTAEDKIKTLRDNWLGRARPASRSELVSVAPVTAAGRLLDL